MASSIKSKQRKGIQSIEIGFDIIKILMDEGRPLSLKDLSAKAKMTPSKIHSYLVSFMNIGLVQQNQNNNFYSLGDYALKMGLTYINQFNVLSVAEPIMNDIASQIGHTIFLGIWGNKGPCIIYRVDGNNSQAFLELRIGSTLPLLQSALGTNFAAHIPKSITEPFIEKELLLPTLKSKFKNINNVYEYLKTVKTNGYSFANQTLYKDFSALSVPIFDYSKGMVAGLTLMAVSETFTPANQKKIIKILQKEAQNISLKLGYNL